ncbi:uncharacterized protein B0J16DRAFT_58911 [Fusarium flagelliforme]|uniref:uncharacterized protein n=1 Tax=Fusarium flagelliforme TaxID=2675880 RepID=UPI001E8DC822|nr:uncharacterized protein B0J16DRAFT_58911 [Fusarium flagelliforme]KAH7192373.1 hypothetical protein B0J16DRAFT_58911 [Fusarium flagelliforme]
MGKGENIAELRSLLHQEQPFPFTSGPKRYRLPQPELEKTFNRFPNHTHWQMSEVTESLRSGQETGPPMHYTQPQRFMREVLRKNVQAERRCPYGTIGDGRPRSGSVSLSPSHEEEISSSPPLTLRDLVMSSVPDTPDREPSVFPYHDAGDGSDGLNTTTHLPRFPETEAREQPALWSSPSVPSRQLIYHAHRGMLLNRSMFNGRRPGSPRQSDSSM